MPKLPWTPWHKVVQLREDLRSGELALHEFAADLDEVARKVGKRKIYEDPAQFFALTYPTTNLRNLAKDVCQRLAGKSSKAIRQLELTYGGGKTHTLITLYHLAASPETLPDVPAVAEFRNHIGLPTLPKARVVVFPFDKLDPEKGMEVLGSSGKRRWLRNPWSLLAWQIAEEEGLRLLHADSLAEERESPPAENLLVELLSLPQKEGLATLLLVDEVLMYAREKVQLGEEWRGRLASFFQYLCQATVKVDRAAMVASLLATDPRKFDEKGRAILGDIQAVFARDKEEGVQPVLREDVAEVLRRRFFTPESIAKREIFKQHAIAALQGIQELDPEVKKRLKTEEERFLASFPFHPDLTEVLYTKWTQLPSFQRTRGVLRIFAIALRDAEAWDESPLVGLNVLLPKPAAGDISEACRELASVAGQEKEEGNSQNWSAILVGELAKARAAQEDQPGLQHREIEEAVLGTFIHSQPADRKATLVELFRLIGPTRPDRISLEKGLRAWLETSWFLDEGADPERKPGINGGLPKVWRLGTRPNLNQMHSEACERVQQGDVETRLDAEIRVAKSLTAGASAAGAVVHLLPSKPSDISDDGNFHYAVLGPAAASESGKPSPEARRFLEENTGPSNPRKERNAVVLVVPSRDALENARFAIKRVLGWDVVRQDLQGHDLDPLRQARLDTSAREAIQRARDAVGQSYSVVVTVGKDKEVQAFKVSAANGSLFDAIVQDPRARIQSEAINAEAILPGGPYDLWRDDEATRRVADIVGNFSRFPHLPKMLRRQAIEDTVATAIREGLVVGRLIRPDKSVRTFWREQVSQALLEEKGFELVLPQHAELSSLEASLLSPGVLPELWSEIPLPYPDLERLFDGTGTLRVQSAGFEEQLAVPKASKEVIFQAVAEVVQAGRLWVTAGPVSVFREPLPGGVLGEKTLLRRPPEPIGPLDLLPDALPGAWSSGQSSPKALHVALAAKLGVPVPWATLSDGISYALKKDILSVVAEDSAIWPCSEAQAAGVTLTAGETPPVSRPKVSGSRTAKGELQVHELQDLADAIGALVDGAGESGFRIEVRLTVGEKANISDEGLLALNEVLSKSGVPLTFS